jgi:hypothetical protein
LGEDVAAGLPHQPLALCHVERAVLPLIERVELLVGVPGIAHRRRVMADKIVEHRGRIVGRLGRRPESHVEVAGHQTVEIALCFDLQMLGGDADLAPLADDDDAEWRWPMG